MKFILINLFLLLSILAVSQIASKDTCYSKSQTNNCLKENEKRLPIIKINSCIFDLLNTIVKKDSICRYFRKDKTAYTFSIYNQKSFYSIEIRPIYLDDLKNIDYFGLFEYKNRKFLCSGCKPEKLFLESTQDSLTITKSLDEEINDFYLGGDVPSKKELINCNNLKLYFVLTTTCD
jgi:hypothetical protein